MFRVSRFRPSSRMHRRRSRQFQPLEPRRVLTTDVIISEFMAENDTTLADGDGDYPDWIELYNASAAPVNLDGWSLTDDALNLDKWEFPAVTLDANEYLVVFASGKDRAVAGQELHTNFQLDDGGEYLALVRADEVTIAAEFSPEYPLQLGGISYGLNTSVSTSTLVDPAAAGASVLVPSASGSLPAGWNEVVFDDTGWIGAGGTAPQGIGYDTGLAEAQDAAAVLAGYNPAGYWRFNETSGAAAANEGSNAAFDGTYTNNPNLNLAGPAPPSFNGFEAGNNATGFDGTDDYVAVPASALSNLSAFTMMGWIQPGNITANRTGLWGQNDAVEFGFISPGTVQIWTPGGGSLDVAWTLGLNNGVWHHLATVGDGTNLKIYIDGALAGTGGGATANYGSSGSQFRIGGGGVFDATGNQFVGGIDEVAIFPGVALSAQQIADYVAAANGAGAQTDFTPLIQTDIEAQMLGVNSTALVRIPFTLSSASFDSLSLDVQYDDGLVAYLNGQEVARANADDPLEADSAANAVRPDPQAVVAESFDLTDFRDFLQVGDNVLAFQMLNRSAGNTDALLRAGLTAVSVTGLSSELRYFVTPSPDGPNGTGLTDLGPIIRNVSHAPNVPTAADPVVVSATVGNAFAAVTGVTLHYRAMYAAEQTLTMLDDGTLPGDVAGDGVYLAVIPAGTAAAGQMLRYYITATDVAATSSRWPLFLQPTNSPEYLGTVIANPAATSELPIFQWFVAPGQELAAESSGGARASAFLNGEFYDNIFVRLRGGTSAGFPNGRRSLKFEFNDGYHFRFDPLQPRVDEINLNSVYTDKSYLRRVLSSETYADAGSPSPLITNWRLQRNGAFYSVSQFVEQADRDFLRRVGLDDDGALYKFYNSFTSGTASVEKKNRRDEDNSDVSEFVNNVLTLTGTALHNYLWDNLDIPRMLNYMSAVVVSHQNDHPHKNYFLYRDSDGSGEWFMFPQDVDLSFGKNYIGDMGGVLSDTIYADDDSVPGRASNIKPSHPFIGASNYREWNNNWNRLLDVLINDPLFRELFLRRLRSVMDEQLQAPGTPAEELRFEQRIDELAAASAPDAALFLGGAIAWPWGTNQSLAQAIAILKNDYLAVRRTHLYNTHSVDNLPDPEQLLLGHSSTARAFVPVDSSLGSTWTNLAYDDSAWVSGPQGVGYERATGYESLIGLNVDALMDPDNNDVNNNNSAYIRLHFNVDDPSAIGSLYLDVKFDDGFSAYLNGNTRVAFNNASPVATWNSAALSDRPDALATNYQTFNITSYKNRLVAGDNVLAIQGMNYAATAAASSDFLIDVQIRNVPPGYADAAGIPHGQALNPTIEFGAVDYNPASGNQDEEYLQLVNPNTEAVDLSGWNLTGGISHTFRKGTVIPAGGSLYVSPKVQVFRARSTGPSGGQGLLVQGNYDGHISNLGETINLVSPDLTVIATITTPATPSDAQQYLRVSEVMYNPGAPTPTESGAGFADNDDFEYLELLNTSAATTLDLSGVRFSQGVDFTFAPGTMLAPGARTLVVKSAAAMAQRYGGGLPIGGEFQLATALSNGGESIRLDDSSGSTILDFNYDDVDPWYPSTDGGGYSLVKIDPLAALPTWNEAPAWRPSSLAGGSPGTDDVAAATIVGRQLFYNNSAFDGNDPGANASDDAAIATDKSALLPGQTATLVNYTSFSKGINGLMIDVENLAGAPTAADVSFRTGNNNSPGSWAALATAPSVSLRLGAGAGGSDRVTLIWPDGTILKRWLQVTVLAGAGTGLVADDVFYFGNAVGESGNTTADAVVNATDEIGARTHPSGPFPNAPVTNLYDFNRDRLVNATDQIIARTNGTNPLTALRLIAAPAESGAGSAAAPLASELVVDELAPAVEQLARRRRR